MSQKCIECSKRINIHADLICPKCGKLPTVIGIFDSMEEMIQDTIQINKKTNELIEIFKKLKLPDDDIRNEFLANMNMLTTWVNLQLTLYRDYGKTTTGSICKKLSAQGGGLTADQLSKKIKNLDILNRRSYQTALMFEVEAFLKKISEILPEGELQGYEQLVKHILRELGILTNDSEEFRKLYYPAIVRNSLHNNGFHEGKKYEGKIKGIPFLFEDGQQTKHAGWRHVYFFCIGILEVVELIFLHQTIQKIYVKGINLPDKE